MLEHLRAAWVSPFYKVAVLTRPRAHQWVIDLHKAALLPAAARNQPRLSGRHRRLALPIRSAAVPDKGVKEEETTVR